MLAALTDETGQESKVSSWHNLPLFVVILPPLGAVLHGRAEDWTDAMILVLICFYLHYIVKSAPTRPCCYLSGHRSLTVYLLHSAMGDLLCLSHAQDRACVCRTRRG